MPKIGIIYGTENTFPAALVDSINDKHMDGVVAEHVKIGSVRMAEPSGYRVIIDRISQDIEFYGAYLKNAMLNGTIVINNPFLWSADDKFFNSALASKLGVAVPRTVVLPHKQHPPGTSVQSMRNLVYPLDWDAIFHYIGFPAYLKTSSGHGWKHLYKVHNPDELFSAYDETGTLCMVLQQAIEFEEYLRCYVVGQKKVRVMSYDPRRPHCSRYQADGRANSPGLHERVVKDSLTLCQALGYDFNAVEFSVQGGTPYVIDFLNPAPEADLHAVGEENFAWIVENIAQLGIERALSDEQPQRLSRWSSFLNPELAETK